MEQFLLVDQQGLQHQQSPFSVNREHDTRTHAHTHTPRSVMQ
jgi:hypothetical protein